MPSAGAGLCCGAAPCLGRCDHCSLFSRPRLLFPCLDMVPHGLTSLDSGVWISDAFLLGCASLVVRRSSSWLLLPSLRISDVFPFSASRGLVQYGRGLFCAHSAAVSDGFGVRLYVVRVFTAGLGFLTPSLVAEICCCPRPFCGHRESCVLRSTALAWVAVDRLLRWSSGCAWSL